MGRSARPYVVFPFIFLDLDVMTNVYHVTVMTMCSAWNTWSYSGRPHGHNYLWLTTRMRFACQPGCTRCCTQKGWVYLSPEDVPRLAAFVGMTVEEFQGRHLYVTKRHLRLRLRQGQCPFLKADGCSVHPAKPTQCRVFPFWPELTEDKKEMDEAAKSCPGIGQGDLISVETLKQSAREMREAYPQQY